MSLILRPNTAPGQAAVVPARASALRDEQAQLQSPNFDEVLVRSLGAGPEPTEKTTPKAVASTAARRQSVTQQDDPAELANAIAMTLVGLDGSGLKTSAGEHRPAGRADPPTSLSEGTQAAAPEAPAPDSAAPAGTARRPGLRLASATTLSVLANPAQAGLAAASEQPTLAPVTETGAAPALAATIGKADRTVPGDAASANRPNTTVAMNADPTAALAGSMLPLARRAGADTPAPDWAAAHGAKQRPGLRVEPAITRSEASGAAATVNPMPASAGPDGMVAVPATAPSTALKGAAMLKTKDGAASDPLTPTPAGTNIAHGPVPDTGQTDRSPQDDEQSVASLPPTLAMSAESAAALAGSMLPLAHRAGADAPAPDTAVAQGTTQRPGLRVEPAMTSAKATGAAPTVNPRPTSAGLDGRVPMTAAAPSTALQGAPALPAGQQSPGQATPQTKPGAAGDNPALAPVAASSAAQLLAADAGQADRSFRDETQSNNSLQPRVTRVADSTTAASGPLRSIDAAAGSAIAASATTRLAARAPREAMTVKGGPLSTGPDATVQGPGITPRPALKAGKMALAGDSDDASQSTPLAVSAGAGEQAAPTLAAATFASQAPGPDPAAPAADAPGASAPSLLHPLQPAAAGATGHAAANTGDLPNAPRLSPEVGSKEWNQALGQQVVQLGKAGQQVTELQLNPPGLGPLQVTLHLNQHQMQVMFVSAHASVRAAVEAAVPQLRASLADSGISLGQTSVSSESQARSAFANQQNSASRQQAYRSNSLPEPAAVGARTLAGARQGGTGRGVDTYA